MSLTAMVRGVGAGWRQQFAADLLARRELVDFVEVIAETCFTQSAARREALALAASWPVIPHGVKLSLGSAGGVDDERVRKLAELARALRAPCVTEHVALTSAGGREIGHLTQLPRTREAVAVVARNVERTRRRLPDVPFVLENVAWTVRWPDDAMREEDFYTEIARHRLSAAPRPREPPRQRPQRRARPRGRAARLSPRTHRHGAHRGRSRGAGLLLRRPRVARS